jgi:hypothetical protein
MLTLYPSKEHFENSSLQAWISTLHQSKFHQGVQHEIIYLNVIKRLSNQNLHHQIMWWNPPVQIYTPCCHITFNFSCIFHRNYASVKMLSRGFSPQCSSRNHRWVHRCKYLYHAATFCSTVIMFSMKIMHRLNFYQGGILISISIKERHGGICRCEYQHHVATSHLTLITFSSKVTHLSIFYQGEFSLNVHRGTVWWSP